MQEIKWTASVHHDSSPRYVSPDQPDIGTTVNIKLRAGLDAPIERVYLRTCPDGEQAMSLMRRAADDEVCQWWEVEARVNMPGFGYRFFIHTPTGAWWLNAAGMSRHTPTDAHDFKLLASYHAPHWVRDAVFYQIFPDRFADGDAASNVRSGEYHCYGQPVVARAWGERPRPHHESGGVEFYGGDLAGISSKLDYLHELGVTALYLNPIFTAPSNHKYDIADYDNVDPHLGGNRALAELRCALDERDMRVILDIAVNHCGAMHQWFRQACEDSRAATAEFFTFHRHPNSYECWLGVKTLPKLDYRSERLRDTVYGAPDAIMRRWLRPPYRIDGWRVDVANMMARQGENQFGHKITRGIRRAVKAENREAYLLGEYFFDGTPHLQGDEMDAGMNYRGFSFPLLQWLAGYDIDKAFGREWADPHTLTTAALAAQWRAYISAIPWQVAVQQFNLLGSHDTPRMLSIVGEDERRARIAATLLFTYPGVPCVYYGDEIGLTGNGDPDNRRCMEWDEARWHHDLRNYYKKLIALRRGSTALRYGGLQMIYTGGDTLSYLRESETERIIVVARRADDGLRALPVRHAGIADNARFIDLLTGERTTVSEGRLPLLNATAGAQIWQEV